MRKNNFILFGVLLIVSSLCFLPTAFSAGETITISTYYPAPYGIYKELRAQRVAIGENYINNALYCWEPNVCTNKINATTTDLVVEGNVGIGTIAPSANLDVKGVTRFQANEYNNVLVSDAIDWAGYSDNVGIDLVKPGKSAPGARILMSGCTASNQNCGEIAFYTNLDSSAAIDQANPAVFIGQSGNVGIGKTYPVVKLEVNGQIKIAGGNPGSGKVLTSDANGLASWQGSARQFGGMYQTGEWTCQGCPSGCESRNPITGTCGCPPGFTDSTLNWTEEPGHDRGDLNHFCWK